MRNPNRKSEAGFGGHHEMMIVIAIVLILLAIAVPAFLDRHAYRDNACALGMLSASAGKTGEVCPVSELPYASGERVACPSKEAHFPTKPRRNYTRRSSFRDGAGPCTMDRLFTITRQRV